MLHDSNHIRRMLGISRNYLLGQSLPGRPAHRYQLRLQT